MSPPTGTVMTTNCELSPVHSTVLKSGYSEGIALIASRCFIFFSGGPILAEIELLAWIERVKGSVRAMAGRAVQMDRNGTFEDEDRRGSDAVRRVLIGARKDILVVSFGSLDSCTHWASCTVIWAR